MRNRNLNDTIFDRSMMDKYKEEKQDRINQIMEIYDALCEKGYDPIAQITGYILTEDPIYITSHKNARIKATQLERDEILYIIIQEFIKQNKK